MHVVDEDNDAEILRKYFLGPDAASLLPMLSMCNIAILQQRPFAASSMAMICANVCKIIEMSDVSKEDSHAIHKHVNECCWDLFDSITRGDLSQKENGILREILKSRTSQPPKENNSAPGPQKGQAGPAPLPIEKQGSNCTLQ